MTAPDYAPVWQLGDMQVIGLYPAKLMKGLAVIADALHESYDGLGDVTKPGHSKECCVFSALAAREFLVRIGFEDAEVKPCTFMARAKREGELTKALIVGDEHDLEEVDHKFKGHAVVTVPSAKLLLDVTLYQALRPHWNGAMSGMMAVRLNGDGKSSFAGRVALAGSTAFDEADGTRFDALWLDRPDIKLRTLTDYKDARSRRRRREIAAALVKRFGEWADT